MGSSHRITARGHIAQMFSSSSNQRPGRESRKKTGQALKRLNHQIFCLSFQFQHFQNAFQQAFLFFTILPTALAIAKFWLRGGTFILKPWHSLSFQAGPYFLPLQTTGCSEDGNWHCSCEHRWGRAQQLHR